MSFLALTHTSCVFELPEGPCSPEEEHTESHGPAHLPHTMKGFDHHHNENRMSFQRFQSVHPEMVMYEGAEEMVRMLVTKSQPCRTVHFRSSVSVVTIPEEEHEMRSELWYSREELASFNDSVSQESNDTELLQSYCIDENIYQAECERKTQRQEVVLDVLMQQELLWEEDRDDPEEISEIYMQDTALSQYEATLRGFRHANHVEELLEEDEDEDEIDYEDEDVEMDGDSVEFNFSDPDENQVMVAQQQLPQEDEHKDLIVSCIYANEKLAHEIHARREKDHLPSLKLDRSAIARPLSRIVMGSGIQRWFAHSVNVGGVAGVFFIASFNVHVTVGWNVFLRLLSTCDTTQSKSFEFHSNVGH